MANRASARLMTTTQLDNWANAVLSELAEHAEYLDEVVVGSTVSGTAKYNVGGGGGGDALSIWRVEIDDEYIDPTTTKELYGSSRTYQAQTGRPRWYYLDSLRLSTVDDTTVGLWPVPNAVYDLRITLTTAPDALTTALSGNPVMLPLWATPGLLWGILSKFYESESRMQNLKASSFYRMMFDDVMTRLRARSYSRVTRSKAYGEGRGRKTSGDLRQLLPADGFPTS